MEEDFSDTPNDSDVPRKGRKPKTVENIFIVEYCGPVKKP